MTNRTLKILYLYNGIFVFGGSLLRPLYAVYVGIIDTSILSVSVTWSAFLISTFIFTFIISRLHDGARSARRMLLTGYIVRAVAWLLFIFASDLSFLVFLQIMLGLGEAVGTPAFDAIFAEHLDAKRHIREYADWKLIANGVTGVGTLIGGLIASRFGFDWLFLAMSVLALVAFSGIWLKPHAFVK